MSEVSIEHKKAAPKKVRAVVITCSTSRYKKFKETGKIEDSSGDLIVNLLKREGHDVLDRLILPDNSELLSETIQRFAAKTETDVLIICGGTGITPTDVTIETVENMLDKKIPGFGELLRVISYNKIGSAAMLTRACAGVYRNKVIFCIPGSPDAVKTAMEELILPEITHVVKHSRGI